MHTNSTLPLMPRLRRALDQAEPLALVYHEQTDGVQRLLTLVDDINDLARQCDAAGLDIAAEHVRIVALNSRLRREATQITRAYKHHAPAAPSHIAGELAHIARQRQQMTRRRILVGVMMALAVVVASWYVVVTTPASADTTEILNAAVAGKQDEAYRMALQEARTFPDDLETQVWVSVLAEARGDTTRAQLAWEKAQRLGDSRGAVLYMRGNNRLLIKQYMRAQQDAALLLNDTITRPEGLFLQGSIAEAQGDVKGAIELMRQAADAADAAQRDEFAVLIRIRMGGLMQYGR